jgi:hypothetical protein
MEILNQKEKKSSFEIAIIKAFKEKSSKLICEKLINAFDEIKYIINEIKKNKINTNKTYISNDISSNYKLKSDLNLLNKSNINNPKYDIIFNENYNLLKYGKEEKSSYILNKNILDKLSRLTERKFFNVNILISRIYDTLLEPDIFSFLSNDFNFLLIFSNKILNLLDQIKSTFAYSSLNYKCNDFLLSLLNSKNLSKEQNEQIKYIIENFPLKNCSKTFKKVKNYTKYY